MADVRALTGFSYNPAKISHFSDVIAPPYDVISSEQKQEYLRRSPYNVVRLILPDGENPYRQANEILHTWIRDEILIQDQHPSIYCYHQTFRTPEGEEKTRKGFLARIRVEDFDKGVVLPHEATLFAPKEDRLKLLRECRTNFSPIFGLYSDPEHKVYPALERFTSTPPRTTFTDDYGVVNTLWAIKDDDAVNTVCSLMKDHWVLIADGHHRYEACLVYRNEMRQSNPDPEAPHNFALMYFTNIHHPGIAIFPYNRAIHQLPQFDADRFLKKASEYFEVKEFEDREQAASVQKREGTLTTVVLVVLMGKKSTYLLKMKPSVHLSEFYPAGTSDVIQKLDVNVLHRLIIHNILGMTEEDVQQQKYLKYYKDIKEERNDFESGRLQAAFFLNPTRVEQVVAVAKAGEKMPQKSTYFHPKVMTGFVLNKHE
jgi:uncharacterized protein (DUF1015 family)